jgi:spermidine/putrescine transport system ATP-binding protein
MPDAGRVILNGEDVTRLPPNKRQVNMVFQDYALFPHMNVRQNISFGLELKGLTRGQIAERLAEVMSFLELEAFAERRPDQLSGGQRQRVALARALAPDPRLLLLDEPLGALDAKLRGQVQQELKSIQRRTGKTFFFVTHDQDEALTMSDRIVVMNAGRVEQDGTPEDLYFHPVSRFVADFVGETNLLTGTVRGTEGQRVVLECSGHEMVGRAFGAVPRVGQGVTTSLRLEKVRISSEKSMGENVVAGRLRGSVFLGSRVALDILVEDCPDLTLRAYSEADPARRPDADGRLWLSWEAADMAVLND